ncbi:MAG: M48 family metalloprotease [Candidatus Paceibacterota bacterium]
MNIYSQIRRNKLKTYFIIFLFIALISALFYLMGQYFGDPKLYFALGMLFSLVSGVGSYFYSDKIVLKMSGARLASKKEHFDFYTVTENLSIAAGIPMPKLYVIEDPTPNAFATGRNPEHAVVAATTGLLQRLKRAEIEGVIAHELSHVRNYDILVMTIVTVLVGTVVFAVDFFMRSLWWGRGRSRDRRAGGITLVIFIVFMILMPFVASLIQLAVSRKREYLADASGALLSRNPDGLADALEKIAASPRPLKRASNATAHLYISNPFKKDTGAKNWLAKLFSTHPPMEERVRILRSM